jgi:hypothetical protein
MTPENFAIDNQDAMVSENEMVARSLHLLLDGILDLGLLRE